MVNTVFVLKEHVSARAGQYGYSYYELVGVFGTRDAAEKKRDTLIKGQPSWKAYFPIEEWQVS